MNIIKTDEREAIVEVEIQNTENIFVVPFKKKVSKNKTITFCRKAIRNEKANLFLIDGNRVTLNSYYGCLQNAGISHGFIYRSNDISRFNPNSPKFINRLYDRFGFTEFEQRTRPAEENLKKMETNITEGEEKMKSVNEQLKITGCSVKTISE